MFRFVAIVSIVYALSILICVQYSFLDKSKSAIRILYNNDDQDPYYEVLTDSDSLRNEIDNVDPNLIYGHLLHFLDKKEYDDRLKLIERNHRDYRIPYPSTHLIDDIRKNALNNEIVITFITPEYIEMFLMFYYKSIIPHDIKNFLVFVSDQNLYRTLKSESIPCTLITQYKSYNKKNIQYGTQGFIDIVNMKTLCILYVLEQGYNVLFTDVDIIFLDNPLYYFNHTYDINAQMEGYYEIKEINSGFMYIHSNMHTLACFYNAFSLYLTQNIRQQTAVNDAVFNLIPNSLSLNELDIYRFPMGNDFFVEGNHVFLDDSPCETCIIVHNNWIKGIDAKIYRLKEIGYYYPSSSSSSSSSNDYYTSSTNNYLTYSISNHHVSIETQLLYLKSMIALSLQLNRILVLPVFYIQERDIDILKRISKYRIQAAIHKGIYISKTKMTTKIDKSKIFNTLNASNITSPSPSIPLSMYNPYYIQRETDPKYNMKKLKKLKTEEPLSVGLNEIICINKFNKYYQNYYREHSFFKNPSIPASLSSLYLNNKGIYFTRSPLDNKHNPQISFLYYLFYLL
ncbi:hypothetical protein WA158_007580 [Blastocystis sp. Blastoise]